MTECQEKFLHHKKVMLIFLGVLMMVFFNTVFPLKKLAEKLYLKCRRTEEYIVAIIREDYFVEDRMGLVILLVMKGGHMTADSTSLMDLIRALFIIFRIYYARIVMLFRFIIQGV